MLYSVAAVALLAWLLWRKYTSALPRSEHVDLNPIAARAFAVAIAVQFLLFFVCGRFTAGEGPIDATYLFIFVFAIPLTVETARFSAALLARRNYSVEFTPGVLAVSHTFSYVFSIPEMGIRVDFETSEKAGWWWPEVVFPDPRASVVMFLILASVVLFHHDMFLLIRNTCGTRVHAKVGSIYFMAVSAHAWYQLFLAFLLYALPAHPSKQLVCWGVAIAVLLIAKMILERASVQNTSVPRSGYA